MGGGRHWGVEKGWLREDRGEDQAKEKKAICAGSETM